MKIKGNILGETGCWEITIESGTIAQIERISDVPSQYWITPGLFDIQVNGYRGVDLTNAKLSIDDVAAVEKEMIAHGIFRWCPTVITAPPAVIEHCLRTIRKAEELGRVTHIHCIHLEGPYLSSQVGYRGIHPVAFLHDPDPAEFDAFQQAAGGRIGLVTLAPERQGAIDFISRLTTESIRVALGHFNADEDTIQQAVVAGATLSTHLFNGCVSTTNRHSNVIYSQLSQDALWASFIPDGHHVPYSTLKVGLRSKGFERSIFISDTISYGGTASGVYEDQYSRKVIVKNEGLWLEDGEYLYGAWQNLMQGMIKCIAHQVLNVEHALRLALLNPAIFFGIEKDIQLRMGQQIPLMFFDAMKLDYHILNIKQDNSRRENHDR